MYIPTTADYLDRLIKHSMETGRRFRYDTDIADAIGITRQTVSQYRGGRNMSIIAAVKLSKLLGIHQMEAVAATMYHQAKTDEDRELWENTFKEYAEK